MKIYKSGLFKLIVICISGYLVVILSRSTWDLYSRNDLIIEREKVFRQVRQKNIELKKRLAEAESPEFIEREARNKLGLGKPGETLVLMVNNEQSASKPAQVQDRRPNWQKWWKLFFK